MSIRKVQTYIREEFTKNISASDFALQKSKMETEAGEAQLPGHLVESADQFRETARLTRYQS